MRWMCMSKGLWNTASKTSRTLSKSVAKPEWEYPQQPVRANNTIANNSTLNFMWWYTRWLFIWRIGGAGYLQWNSVCPIPLLRRIFSGLVNHLSATGENKIKYFPLNRCWSLRKSLKGKNAKIAVKFSAKEICDRIDRGGILIVGVWALGFFSAECYTQGIS